MAKWRKTTMIPTHEQKLAECVEKIERGMQSSVEGSREVGEGLAEIRDRELYRGKHLDVSKAFCVERFGFTPQKGQSTHRICCRGSKTWEPRFPNP